MQEPNGRTFDGTPWEEARPPHLPDRLTSVPLAVWPFVVLAVLHVAMGWSQIVAEDPARVDVVRVAFVVLRVAPILLGAALFWRHGDAHRTLPRMAIGVTLIAIASAIVLLRPGLERWLEQVTAGEASMSAYLAIILGIGAVTTLLHAAGISLLALGLRAARRSERPVGRIIFAAAGLAAVVMGSAWLLPAPFGDPGLLAVVLGAVLPTIELLAWAGLLAVAAVGAMTEREDRGWALFAAGAATVLAVRGAALLVALVGTPPDDGLAVGVVLGLGLAAGPILVLGGLLLGTPRRRSRPD